MKLVADANVLLSAVLGGRASQVMGHSDIEEIFTTAVTFAEVQEYAVILAHKEKLPLDALLLAVAALPVSIVDAEVYEHSLDRARKLIGKRDPEDIEILALALHLRVALWSNDNDFEQTGVEWFTTAELLQRLGISGKR